MRHIKIEKIFGNDRYYRHPKNIYVNIRRLFSLKYAEKKYEKCIFLTNLSCSACFFQHKITLFYKIIILV